MRLNETECLYRVWDKIGEESDSMKLKKREHQKMGKRFCLIPLFICLTAQNNNIRLKGYVGQDLRPAQDTKNF